MALDREEVLRVAIETGLIGSDISGYDEAAETILRFAAHFFEAGARAEREECAKVCDQIKEKAGEGYVTLDDRCEMDGARYCADAIRARTT